MVLLWLIHQQGWHGAGWFCLPDLAEGNTNPFVCTLSLHTLKPCVLLPEGRSHARSLHKPGMLRGGILQHRGASVPHCVQGVSPAQAGVLVWVFWVPPAASSRGDGLGTVGGQQGDSIGTAWGQQGDRLWQASLSGLVFLHPGSEQLWDESL